MTHRTKSCRTCHFFRPTARLRYPAKGRKALVRWRGRCLRFPPQAEVGYPRVWGRDACGEWQPHPKMQEAPR